MADEQDQNDQSDDLDVSDEDAERLLADPEDSDDEPKRPRRRARKEGDDSDDDKLGEPGKRALEAEKEKRRLAREEATAAKRERDALKAKLDQLEDSKKSDLQRLLDERDALKDQLSQVSSKAKRREIAEELAPEHASAKAIRLVAKYLAGSSDDELEASAEELFEQFAPAPKDPPKPRTPGKPQEKRLRGGGDPEEDEGPTDPRALADLIRKNR
jgi:hypothetical protein